LHLIMKNEAGVISSSKIRRAAIGNAQIGTAAIGTANIGTLTFNQISGGTATLGGATNGNGLLQVLNAVGGTVITADNTGLTINSGSMTLKDVGGTTIMDATGLVSTANFAFGGTTVGIGTTASSSYVSLAGGTVSIVLSRTSNVLFLISGGIANTDTVNGHVSSLALNVNGVDETRPYSFWNWSVKIRRSISSC
jgi:hypothetical protein